VRRGKYRVNRLQNARKPKFTYNDDIELISGGAIYFFSYMFLTIVLRSAKRILAMIAISWAMSAVISVPPLFGLKHSADYWSGIEEATSTSLPTAANFTWNSSSVMAASTLFQTSSLAVDYGGVQSAVDVDSRHENARTLPSKVWDDRYPVVKRHLLTSLFRTFFRREPSTAVDRRRCCAGSS
jgi:hypothetical protein